MTTKASRQKSKPCASCPWMAEGGDRSLCFDPDTLEKTVVEKMRNGGIHPCHANNEDMCAGYLSFAEHTLPAGAATLQMVRIGNRLGLIDYDLIDDTLPVYESVDEMLEDHERRCFMSVKVSEDVGNV